MFEFDKILIFLIISFHVCNWFYKIFDIIKNPYPIMHQTYQLITNFYRHVIYGKILFAERENNSDKRHRLSTFVAHIRKNNEN